MPESFSSFPVISGTGWNVAAGSFAQFGELKLWQVLAVGSVGSVLGDQIGYVLGRWGGPAVKRLSQRIGGTAKVKQAEDFTRRWGASAIFFTRWLVTPLGPWLNLTSGMAAYPWAKFLLWDVIGETLWVVIYVCLGKLFSDSVQSLVEILGSLTWVIVGLVVAALLGWQLLQYLRPIRVRNSAAEKLMADSTP